MKQTILKAIELSQITYLDQESIMHILSENYKLGFRYTFNIKQTDAQGFMIIEPKEKRAWVVIRGTSSIADWGTNLNIAFSNSPWGKVHTGFYTDALSIKNEIDRQLKVIPIDYQIVYTGHSQGAAVATQLFLMDITENSICIPIESPRSCSVNTAKIVGIMRGERIWPVIHNNDIVVRAPPACAGYGHISKTNTQYINRKGKVSDKLPWFRKWYDSLMGYIDDVGKPGLDAIKDHDLDVIYSHWLKYTKENNNV